MSSESLFKNCRKCGHSISKSKSTCIKCGTWQINLRPIHWLGIALVAFFIIGKINAPEEKNKTANDNSPTVSIHDVVSRKLTLDYTWGKSTFGSMMEATFIINNKSAYDVKDIQILCTHFAKSETKIDSNERTIFEVIKANSKETYLNFNMGFILDQVNSTSCELKDFSLTN